MEVSWVPGPAMLADAMTKGLPAQQFKRHRDFWGLVETTPSDDVLEKESANGVNGLYGSAFLGGGVLDAMVWCKKMVC